jgi:hypothetical protein
MSISIAPVKRNVASYTGGSATLTIGIDDSSYYTRFVFQVKGFTAGVKLSVHGSVNGQDWAPLDSTSTFLASSYTVSTANTVIILDTYAPLPGGLRFVLDGVSAASGTIHTCMTASPYNTNRA